MQLACSCGNAADIQQAGEGAGTMATAAATTSAMPAPAPQDDDAGAASGAAEGEDGIEVADNDGDAVVCEVVLEGSGVPEGGIGKRSSLQSAGSRRASGVLKHPEPLAKVSRATVPLGVEGEAAGVTAEVVSQALTAADAERLLGYEQRLYRHVAALVDGATAATLFRCVCPGLSSGWANVSC